MEGSFIKLNGVDVSLDEAEAFVDNNSLNRISVQLQSGPIAEVGVNGAQIDDVIQLAKNIIGSFNKRCPCRENAMVITKLDEAILWLLKRKNDRIKRKVEGTNLN